MKRCPKCGNKVNKVYDGLCRECSAYEIDLFKFNKKDITICVSCNTVIDGKKQHKGDVESSIKNILKTKITPNKFLKDPIISIDFQFPKHKVKHGLKLKTQFTLRIRAKTEANVDIQEEFNLPVTIRYITCEKCSKKNTNYFEGIIQLRHDNRKKVDEAIEYLKEIMIEEEKRSVFATNQIDSKRGSDVYITSQKYIKEIGKKVFEKFGGKIKINEQLFSKDNQTGKNLYRVNVLIRLPDFENGSIILSKEKLIRIKRIKGYHIMGEDLIFKKNSTLTYKDKDIELISLKEDLKETTITRIRPMFEVINPDNYQSEQVQNPEKLKNQKIGTKIKVFLYKQGIWVI